MTLLLILVSAKIGGELAKRIGQPAVLGELIAGVLLGSSVLGLVRPSDFFNILAQIGAIVLLFEAGITSDYPSFMAVKLQALSVALVGVVFSFILVYPLSIAIGLTPLQSVFLGATLTATSIGITVRVFRDLGSIASREAQIVIGAAVADDIIGLVILGAMVGLISPRLFSMINIGRLTGLAPIAGAYVVGLILSRTASQEYFAGRIKPVAVIFVPIFFVMMGVAVDAGVFNPFNAGNYRALALAGLLFIAAVAGKLLSGLAVRGKLDKLLIGVGMIPRGEVGLIFAAYGLSHGVLDHQLYSALLAVIVLTTFITPPLLKYLLTAKK